ncbi:MAG: hypothetical protein Q8M09_04670 [Pseudomonadota bacterium]|nr:hypothetical protein [Pseudomonadota bacterium]
MPDNASSSAGPALRGFRLQILYTLFRLIEAPGVLQAALYWPETVEDLAIYGQDGLLREAIQVKAHSASLTLNDLDPKLRHGLLRRVLETLRQNPTARVWLVSFGPIGEELVQAWGGDGPARERVGGKLKQVGFSPEDIHRLFKGFDFEKVDEAQVVSRIEAFFHNHPLLFGQSRHASASLYQWLYGAAERGERLAYADLIDKVGSIGRYIQERAAHIQTWLTSITPLDEAPEDVNPSDGLLAEFQTS